MSSIEAVIFDLDGTLIDTETLAAKAIQRIADQFDKCVEWDTQKKLLGLRGPEWSRILIAELHLEGLITPEEVVRQWECHLNSMCELVMPMDGAMLLIDACKRLKLKMAIATSSNKVSALKKLQRHPIILENMIEIVTGDDPEVFFS